MSKSIEDMLADLKRDRPLRYRLTVARAAVISPVRLCRYKMRRRYNRTVAPLRKLWWQGNRTLFVFPWIDARIRYVATTDAWTGKFSRRVFICRKLKAPCYGPNWKERPLLSLLRGR